LVYSPPMLADVSYFRKAMQSRFCIYAALTWEPPNTDSWLWRIWWLQMALGERAPLVLQYFGCGQPSGLTADHLARALLLTGILAPPLFVCSSVLQAHQRNRHWIFHMHICLAAIWCCEHVAGVYPGIAHQACSAAAACSRAVRRQAHQPFGRASALQRAGGLATGTGSMGRGAADGAAAAAAAACGSGTAVVALAPCAKLG